ncbi:MAG: response regulator [Pseudomonadota bacterium]
MILIVDDDEGMTQSCTMLLEAHGYDVQSAASGPEALSMMKESAHELLISDCEMPGMTGAELSEQVRADPSTTHMPVLLMSASRRCDVTNGATYNAFLRKPFLAAALLAEVSKLVQKIAPLAPLTAKV